MIGMGGLTVTYSSIEEALQVKPFDGKGAQSVQEIYLQVGELCASFEQLEDEVVMLFQVLCGELSTAPSRMSRIISVVTSFKTKLDILKEAAQAFLSRDPDKKEAVLLWLKLCRKASEIRNKVVHANPAQIAYVDNEESRQEAFLLPSIYDRKSGFRRGSVTRYSEYCWNTDQLRQYNMALLALRGVLMTVREELAGTAEEPQPWVLDPCILKRK